MYADRSARKRQQAAEADQSEPPITPEDALAELDAMVGLGPVKEQVHSIYVSIEAARRRAEAGFGADKPMRHFVFLGPPGTGKTTVARVIGKIFYAFGLLESADVVEAQRSDLVGEYLGATAIKTNELVDSALGRVLFIDEAYSLVNEGDGQSDRFGAEAVQTLLKRAEDDREHLIIILAGVREADRGVPGHQPGPGVAVRDPHPVPHLLDRRSCSRWPSCSCTAGRSCWRPTPGRPCGGCLRRSAAAAPPTSSATAGSSAPSWRKPARRATCG